jgi:transposase
MNSEQAEALKVWFDATVPRSTRRVGAWIEKEFDRVYNSRSGLIAMLHRLWLEYRKPKVVSRNLPAKQVNRMLGFLPEPRHRTGALT